MPLSWAPEQTAACEDVRVTARAERAVRSFAVLAPGSQQHQLNEEPHPAGQAGAPQAGSFPWALLTAVICFPTDWQTFATRVFHVM